MGKARFPSASKAGPLLGIALLLAACSAGPFDESSPTSSVFPEEPGLLASYDFHWQLSGRREVAPLQVFNDERQVWLQYAPGQAVPAIFGVYRGRAEPLSPRRHGSYYTVPGAWPELQFRGGALVARAVYGVPTSAGAQTSNSEVDAAGAVIPSESNADVPRASAAAGSETEVTPTSGTRNRSFGALPHELTASFVTLESDDTMRRVLTRWAAAAGWTFNREHWAVDVDIPLAGQARFQGGFQHAVRGLLASTEMGDRPLQPCFYANRVLRVIALTQPCDRRRRVQALSQ